jgi:hypothetical protein
MTDTIRHEPGPAHRGFAECTEAEARAAYVAMYGREPARVIEHPRGVWLCGPVEGR